METINLTETTAPAELFTVPATSQVTRSAMLLSELWNEGELAVLFGDSTVGKSLLAVQVAEAISRGEAVSGFSNECTAQKVLYFDFDNGDRKFAGRYRQHTFSDNFSRVTISKQFTGYHKFGKHMFASMAEMIQATGSRVLVIDSLGTLQYFMGSRFFIFGLLHLKSLFNLSVLVLGETKKPKHGKPLFMGNLAYNKTLAGVADSVFAMGANVTGAEGRYLIQLKGKESGRVYNEGNVIIGSMVSAGGGDGQSVTGTLPGFKFTGYGTERQQLLCPPTGLDAEILALKQQEPTLTLGEIARRLKTNKMKVRRVLELYQAVTPVTPKNEFKIGNWIPPAPHHTNPFRGDVEPTAHPSDSGVTKEPVTPTGEFANKTSLPLTDSRLRGNDGQLHSATAPTPHRTDPSRGDVEPTTHPSGPWVMKPESQPAKKLSYSQELRLRLNKASKERKMAKDKVK